MRPLVWDFGHLTDHTEELYTKQTVRRFLSVGATTVTIMTVYISYIYDFNLDFHYISWQIQTLHIFRSIGMKLQFILAQ